MKNSRSGEKIKLTSIDELLGVVNEESAMEIEIKSIIPFKGHPFKVIADDKMEELINSVKESGVITPVLLRPAGENHYEMISGHRRMYAARKAGLSTVPAIVRDMTDDEAVIAMVDSNIQREELLPSEKAFAYKMRLEAMKRQAGRPPKENSSPMGTHLRSDAELAEKVGESRNQIQRYIRLTELVPEILQMVDDRQIAFRPAVEISYLSEEQQYTLLEAMSYNDATPSLAQAIKMKKFMQEGKLTDEVISSIMEEEKPNQREKPAFRDERITKLIPKSIPRGQETDFVVKALEFYNRHLQRNKAHER